MIISTHRLEERSTYQAWMAAGPGWHKAVGDSGCPGSQQSSIYFCLWLHGQCWAPDFTSSEHFQLLSFFWFLIHTRIQVWYLQLVCEAPQEMLLCSTIAVAGGFPTVKWNTLGFPCCGAVWRCSAPRGSSIWAQNHSSMSILILALSLPSIHQF